MKIIADCESGEITSRVLTQSELDEQQAEWAAGDLQRRQDEARLERRGRYTETDALKNELEYDGGDLQIWRDAVAAIKAEIPIPQV